MHAFPLARLLADGELRTIEWLSGQSGLGAARVEQLLGELEAAGLQLTRDARGSIRLPGGLELLSREKVLANLSAPARSLLTELDLHPQLGSTNTEAMRRLRAGSGPGLVVSAEQQTAGRGRRGRSWASPFACNLYLSCAWEFAGGGEAIEGLSLAVGVAVAESLVAAGLPDVTLKWPNDVMHRGAKLGGILIETSGGAGGPLGAVIGIGLNLRMPAPAAAEIDQSWTDLARLGVAVERNALMSTLLNALLPLLPRFEAEGLAPWRERWQRRNAFVDSDVRLQQGDRQVVGRMLGIGHRGELRLDVGGTEQAFDGGEVSLRLVR